MGGSVLGMCDFLGSSGGSCRFGGAVMATNEIDLDGKSILDMCCGSRMFWFDKQDERTVFSDKRSENHVLCDGRKLVHLHSERVMVEGKPISGVPVKDSTCPRCGCKEFYIIQRDDEESE